MVHLIEKQGYVSVPTERDLYKALGKGPWFDAEMAKAKRDAKMWREHTKGKRHPGGMGAMVFSLPESIVNAARKAHEEIYIAADDKPRFWCDMWHRYEDLRCVNWKNCPWCHKRQPAYSFRASRTPSTS